MESRSLSWRPCLSDTEVEEQMTSQHGGKVGPLLTLVDDTGNSKFLFSILIIGDGYTKAEAVSVFVKEHCATLIKSINKQFKFKNRKLKIYAQPYWSKESGADIPKGCAHGFNVAHPKTYFDSGFSADCRLLAGTTTNTNSRIISHGRDAFRSVFPLSDSSENFAAILVLVNTPHYGGAFSDEEHTDICWAASSSCDSVGLALHELGHSMDLADEYDYWDGCEVNDGGATGTVFYSNVSSSAAQTPWNLKPPYPTDLRPKLECGQCDQRHEDGLEDGVGVFQGANHSPCGFFRPTRNCRMRNVAAPFCKVCRLHIRKFLT